MGRDKALIEIEGVPLWQRQLRILQDLKPHEIFLSGSIIADGCKTLPDARANTGPIGGLVASLRHCSTPLLIVLAVDLPKMTTDFFSGLLRECSLDCGVIPMIDHRFEPLAGIYPKAALALAERQLESNEHSLQTFCRDCAREGLVRPRQLTEEEKRLFQNLNTPADLTSATRM